MQYSISIILNKKETKLPVIFKVNRRTNKVILHPESNAIKVTVPGYLYIPSAMKFVSEKKEWIAKQIEKKQPLNLKSIRTITFLDKKYDIRSTDEKLGVAVMDDTIYISGDKEFRERRLNDFLKKEFMKYVHKRVRDYGKILGKLPARVTLKSVSSRHGSCSSAGNICISDKLLLAPTYVIDYIIAHELSHLKEMNHSAKFWSLCEKIYNNDTERAKAWLRLNI
ncbi:MAG: M48 family metallopeptidase [Rickettsiales bacterium]|jgi:predicted metal-dependent hydrolase|nr:M48 family metallopeptidase [Rickettsiales bacterium]